MCEKRYHSYPAHHNRVNIYIEDDGPGIAEKELEQVFEPFYRGEHSRSRDTGRCGLGFGSDS
ncbi:ATP-binding protein [Coxiella-like endosymbiont of Rhipicephalus sanguineus]|uniref:ATP-binding protein n=1 Tax=Coxiella-like endosymbiont of Rhipicephalus sanguineus TaxID=1955402 RepID=UPI00203D673A|nr:ATP-binding protein [Coxiella-like endosymbiont of Rhipicephalus sanguineus]